MLQRVALLLSGLMLFASSVGAAEIYGQLWDVSKKTPLGAKVSASCGNGNGEPVEVEVDEYGRYRLTDLPLQKNCALTIVYNNLTSSNPTNIYTADNRNSANFMLKVSNGRLLLIRR